MSSSIYYIFDLEGKVLDSLELRNGFGSVPAIWAPLCEKYNLGMWFSGTEKLYALSNAGKLPDDDCFLMEVTSDYAITPRSQWSKLIEVVGKFGFKPLTVNHWPEVCSFLRKHINDERAFGMGIYPTSVNEDPWATRRVYEDEENEESPYTDIRRDPLTQPQAIYGEIA